MIAYVSTFAASLVLIVFFADWVWKRFLHRHRHITPKELSNLPLLGHAHHFPRNPQDFFTQIRKMFSEYGYIAALWIGPLPIVVTGRQEDAELMLKDQRLLSKSFMYDFLHQWLRTGLLTSDGAKWKERRKLLTPTFHFSILQDFAEVFKREADILVEKVKPYSEAGEVFDISEPITLCTLDVICATAMGIEVGAQHGNHVEYTNAVKEFPLDLRVDNKEEVGMAASEKNPKGATSMEICPLRRVFTLECAASKGVAGLFSGGRKIVPGQGVSRIIQMRQRGPWLWPDFLFKLTNAGAKYAKDLAILHGFTAKVIKDRIASRKRGFIRTNSDGRQRRLAFLDLLLDNYDANHIDVDGIQEEVDTFMFEGHDTTSHGISWTLYLLGRHPEIQKKVHEEIDKYFVEDLEGLIDAAKSMDLLGRTIKESLRLYPPVPFIGRKVTEEFHDVGKDIHLKKGENLLLFIFALHRNERIWTDPLKFDPDRFLPEHVERRHPFAYVPFSAGSRNCIGQRFAQLEEKIVLAKFLRHYEILSLDGEESLDLCGELITRAGKGIRVQIKARTT